MIGKIGKLISGIILIFLVIILLVRVFFISQEKIYDNDYPNIKGYSYIKVSDKFLEPDIKEGEFVLLTNNEAIKEGDFVVYKLDGKRVVRKVLKEEDDKYILTDDFTLEKSKVLAKVYYKNSKISLVLNIFTNKIVVLVMLILVFILPVITYKRY